MHFFTDYIKGIVIGAGAILPGVSSGVICVVFGIYETLLNCVLNFFKNIKQNFKILFPIVLGIFSGILIFGNILKYIFYAYPLQTKFIFIGLILGNIPTLLKEACKKQPFKPLYLIYFLITFIIGIILVSLENRVVATSSSEYSYIYLIISGFLMSAGVIIPGVSSTLILMLLGVYDAYLISVSSLYLPLLIPMGIGLIIGSIVCMKLIQFLLDKFYTQTFFSIIGFTIGSIFILYPGFTFDINGLISVLSLLLGIFIASLFN